MTTRPDGSIVVETLGDYLDVPYYVCAWCEICQHNAMLPLEEWAVRYGRDAKVERFTRRLTCGKCGSRRITTSSGYYLPRGYGG